MTPTPEQWDLAKLRVEMANSLMQREWSTDMRKVVLAHLEIARQALNPVTDEERAG
jgi:hypothetical protein